jgi:protein-S-isoprenylcysteine O-methyltransferase Ste14
MPFSASWPDYPLLSVTVTTWVYWSTVVVLAVRKRIREGRSAGFRPRDRFERRLWRVILPVVGLWLLLPTLALFWERLPGVSVPRFAAQFPWWSVLRWAAAAAAPGLYLLSLASWRQLGRHWTMAIVPRQTSGLVTTGIYGWVRHPIYSLSMALMLCTLLVLPTVPMALVAALHILVFVLKARREEEHLRAAFGEEYEAYCRSVGRFVPRLRPLWRSGRSRHHKPVVQ